MKDTAVDPAGLFDIKRQRRLLDGMINRFSGGLLQRQMLQAAHAQQQAVEESQFAVERARIANECRIARRTMLEHWERAEEKLARKYEGQTTTIRHDLNRLAQRYQQKSQAEQQILRRKVNAREQAVMHQYENRKNQPGQQQRKEFMRINDALEPINELVQEARDLTLKRLEHIPEVSAEENPDQEIETPTPTSLDQTIELLSELHSQGQQLIEEMQASKAANTIHYLLPAGVLIFFGAWAGIGYVLSGGSLLWSIGGIVPAIVLGFVVYLALMAPVKKNTQRLYPTVERLGRTAAKCAEAGQQISREIATAASNELSQRRDAHRAATRRWMEEQLELLNERIQAEQQSKRKELNESLEAANRNYIESFSNCDREMRTKADAVAKQISSQLTAIDGQLQTRRQANVANRQAQIDYLTNRLTKGIRDGIRRMNQTAAIVEARFPDWPEVLIRGNDKNGSLSLLPLGWLHIDETLRNGLREHRESASSSASVKSASVASGLGFDNAQLPKRLPITLHRRLYSTVVVRCASEQMSNAIGLVHQCLWRLLSAAPPSRAKLTLIDPIGHGQNFTNFMALADHDPSIVGHRVWTTADKIESRLAELADYAEDILQANLRDRFERIEDYNEIAGSMAQPYRAVAAVGLPDGLSPAAYRHLNALVESGLRCGVFVMLVCDKSKPWPADMPLPDGEKVLRLEIDDRGDWKIQSPGFEGLPFEPCPPPPPSLREDLVDSIGSAAIAAARITVPLHGLFADSVGGNASSDDGLSIAIGSEGAGRIRKLRLGEGVRQHVLIAGKTGSGKSTLLHSIIGSGAHRYRPDQLEFYLLDFKKGVEFKPYAELHLPHVRVIGIESEREFGRSALQRLDRELQRRGERYRALAVSDLAEYRKRSATAMPRIMLVIDEFQELFVRDDRLAADCAMLLDRLVRQGRSFGIHVVLSSQSLAGAYSLPRATLGQMAVRIALQCSESDASLILADDNGAARLISRPGEAIYNDAGGLAEGNQPFQVAWLAPRRQEELLTQIAARDADVAGQLPLPVVFEGNRPCHWSPELADNAAIQQEGDEALHGLLGEAVEIGPAVTLPLARDPGRNVLIITPPTARQAVIGSVVSSLAKAREDFRAIYFAGGRDHDDSSLAGWISHTGIPVCMVKPRDAVAEIESLVTMVQQRADDHRNHAPILVIVDPLERFREFRQDDSFNFSLHAAADAITSGSALLQTLLRDGPSVGVHVMLVCSSVESLSRWLPRSSQHDLQIRILGQMNASDSSMMIDSPAASELSPATLLRYDDSDGSITKFRQCRLPDAEAIRDWLNERGHGQQDGKPEQA